MEKQDKLTMHTANIADANFSALAKMFPNAVTETVDENGEVIRAIDAEVLAQEINTHVVSGKEERYQFTWPDKKKSVLLANAPIAATLRPSREESVDFDKTENLYIEGDNLDVLKLLRETYLNRVKMVYIDPPYNTGKDFIYEDNFAEETSVFLKRDGQYDEQGNRLTSNFDSNGRFHTDWLNMMYPRLRVARDLLDDDGVIFISIDDNEVENLKRICNEIFGERNFVMQVSWRRTDNQPNIGNFARVKEYVLCYCKNKQSLSLGKLPLTEKAKNEYRYEDEKGKFRRGILLDKTRGRHKYPIITKSGGTLMGPWMLKEEDFRSLDEKGGIYWTSGGDEQPYGKIYLSESKGQIPNDFWGIEFGTNQRASLEVEKLFEKRLFDFPKPVSLIKTLISIGSDKEAIVLDFFSGSSTTAHAVMQLNSEDGGNRKFIMVQIPEETDEKSEAYKEGYKNICEIGKERIRRAGNKIKEEAGLTAQNLDVGFRVLKLDSSNMKEVYYTPEEYSQMGFNLEGFMDNIKPDRSDEDLLFQVMLDLGIPLSAQIEQDGKIFKVNENYLIACFDRVDTSMIIEIAQKQPYYAIFRDSSFVNDSALVNVEQIFNTYSPSTIRRVL